MKKQGGRVEWRVGWSSGMEGLSGGAGWMSRVEGGRVVWRSRVEKLNGRVEWGVG